MSPKAKYPAPPPWFESVRKTVERDGWDLLRHAFRNLSPLPPIPDRRWHPRLEELLIRAEPGRSMRTQWLPLFLKWVSLSTGYTVGLQIPRLRLRLMQVGAKRNRIVIDGAWLHLGIAFVEWWRLIFERAQCQPTLSPDDRAVLIRIQESLHQFEQGLLQGSALKTLALRPLEKFKWFRAGERKLFLKAGAFEKTANWLQRLGK